MKLILLFLALLAAIPYQVHAQTVHRTIEVMNFRGVSEDDPLLGKPFKQKEAFYAFRPPAGWKEQPLTKGEKPLEYAIRYKDPKNSDFMTVGLLEGGPKDLTIESLSLFRGDYLGKVRKMAIGRIVGSDLFRFNHYYCLQVIAQKNDTVVLQLLVFDKPGSFIQMAFSVAQSRYHGLARTLEACIASLDWPAL